jgi:hypothetical protein
MKSLYRRVGEVADMGGLRVVAMALLGCDSRANQPAMRFHHADGLANSPKLLPLLHGDLLLHDRNASEPLSFKEARSACSSRSTFHLNWRCSAVVRVRTTLPSCCQGILCARFNGQCLQVRCSETLRSTCHTSKVCGAIWDMWRASA